MYYILLHKWDKGQLQIPTISPSLPSTYHRFSTSCLPPPSVPQINIEAVDSLPGSSGIVPQWQTLNAPVTLNPNESTESNMDDNLERYLNLGRRHTLGAAHNVMLVPQEEMNRLRKINESSSSQASSGFGSVGTNPQIHPEVLFKLLPTLSTGVDEKQINSSDRQHLQPPLHRSSRRRSSDGGHSTAAYRMYLEKKNPLYAQMSGISPNTTQESTSNSVRHMLQDKIETDKRYGRLPSAQKQWIQYKNQLSVNSTGVNSTPMPCALPPIVRLSTMVEPCIDLREQLQPFQEISPQEIQTQLQQLHLKAQNESTSNRTPSPQGFSSIEIETTESSSSVTSSRRGSTSSSILAQLLSSSTSTCTPNYPVLPNSTQTSTTSTAEYINSLEAPINPRRFSMQSPSSSLSYCPRQVHKKRNTLPELTPNNQPIFEDNILPLLRTSQELQTELESSSSQEVNGTSPENSYFVQSLNQGHQSPSFPYGSPGRISPSSLQVNDGLGRPISPGVQERQRRQGITLNTQQHVQLATSIINNDNYVGNPGTTSLRNGMFIVDQPAILVNGVHHVPISYSQDSLQTTQHIPIYLNQHMSLLHPKVANQIAQQQVGELVTHISLILKRFGIVYECNSNIFTISHQGVEFQIHVQVSPHFTLQNALQLNLQYMHVSGDPQLYQNLCTQLAPHFIPTVQ